MHAWTPWGVAEAGLWRAVASGHRWLVGAGSGHAAVMHVCLRVHSGRTADVLAALTPAPAPCCALCVWRGSRVDAAAQREVLC